jgi:hypothetical protein
MFLRSKLERNLGYELIQSTLGVDVQDCEIPWLADLILVPGVKISNVGAGLIEAFAYIAASFIIALCF